MSNFLNMRLTATLAALVLVAGCPNPNPPDDSEAASSSSGNTGVSSSSAVASSGGTSSGGGTGSSGASGSSGPSGGGSSVGTESSGTSQAASSGGGGSSSSGGGASSAEGCTDECTASAQVCDGSDGFRVCGQFDVDSCLELSPRIGCAQGYVCDSGNCIVPCTDECPVGGTACQDTDTRVSCGQYDSDACRELGAPVDCGANERCENGGCVPANQACTDECAAGSVACFGNATRTCGNFDADTCLDLGPSQGCDAGETCTNGVCAVACTDDCAAGARECSGAGFRTCGGFDSDSCRDWSAVTACGAGEACSNGTCSATCTDECATSGATLCSSDGMGTRACGQFDADACLDLGTSVPCGPDSACTGGACMPTCTDGCAMGATRCGTDGVSVETCGNYDADGCREFGGTTACGGSATCTNGTCNTPCTEDCAVGARECSGAGFRTCGQFDTDSCRDWSAVSACMGTQTCNPANGMCELGATPAVILINEILYDSMGTDTSANNTLLIELRGPAGQSLDGYEVVGINGSGGVPYNAISLEGEVMAADGFFLITRSNGLYASMADLTNDGVDMQQGPDSVQVRWNGRVVDAVGYGNFTTGNPLPVFAGEGTAAPGTPAGSSLTRNAAHADTNNNAADFSVAGTPTPRGNPVACINECTAGAMQCAGAQVQVCVTNADADACTEWSTATNCPNGQSCSGGSCQLTCTDECTAGGTQCSGQNLQTCVTNADADSCTEWGPAAACSTAGHVCNNGVCAPSCSNECTAGATRCMGMQVQTCVTNGDADPCTEWGTATACSGAGEQCVGGSCTIPCNNDCPAQGATTCQGAQVLTCGNYDADSCLEYSAAANCPNGQVCSVGAC